MLLTATCPPTLADELLKTLGINKCRTIRAPTSRPEISYNVVLCKTSSEAKRLLLEAVGKRLKGCSPSFRGLVYCRGKKTTDDVARDIGCNPFHSERPEEERKDSFSDWVAGGNKFIVSTSLLGCGIDVEGVDVIYHYLTPWSVMDFVQESGRAGRGGAPAESWVFASESDFEKEMTQDQFGYTIMRKWVFQSSECRRVALGSFLDGRVVTCTLLPNASFCDVCKRLAKEPHPRQPVELIPTVTPPDCVPRIGSLPPIPPPSIKYAQESLGSGSAIQCVWLTTDCGSLTSCSTGMTSSCLTRTRVHWVGMRLRTSTCQSELHTRLLNATDAIYFVGHRLYSLVSASTPPFLNEFVVRPELSPDGRPTDRMTKPASR